MIWAFFGTIVVLWFLVLMAFGLGIVIHAMAGLRRGLQVSVAAIHADQHEI